MESPIHITPHTSNHPCSPPPESPKIERKPPTTTTISPSSSSSQLARYPDSPRSSTISRASVGYSTFAYEATILKWTNYVSQWQWRYLQVSNGKLMYFKSKADKHLGCRGELHLAFASVQGSFYDPCRFDVSMSKTDARWNFRADSEIHRDRWVALIKSNIELALRVHNHKPKTEIENQEVTDNTLSQIGYYEHFSSTSSLAGGGGGCGSITHESAIDHQTPESSLNSLRKAIIDVNAYKKILFSQLNQIEKYFEHTSTSNRTTSPQLTTTTSDDDQCTLYNTPPETSNSSSTNIRCDILNFKTTVNNVQKTLSSATDILSTHENTWRIKFRQLSSELNKKTTSEQQQANRIKDNQKGKRGHRRATSLTTAAIQIERPTSINIKPAPSARVPTTQLTPISPITDEEFFDAIDQFIGSAEQKELADQHNQAQFELIREISTSSQVDQLNSTVDTLLNEYMYDTVNEIKHRYAERVLQHINQHCQSLDTSLDNDAGWMEFYKEGSMTMFRRDQATPEGRVIDPLRLFHRIEGVSAYECQHYFWDTKFRLEWEHTIESFKILEVLDATTIVLFQDHKRVWPAAKRDAVYLSSLQQVQFPTDDPCYIDTWCVTNFSVEHEQSPYKPTDNQVRVFIDVCMICQTYLKDPNKPKEDRNNVYTKIIYISQVDPGGWLPPAALRKIYKKEYPRFLRTFSKYVKDKTKRMENVNYQKF